MADEVEDVKVHTETVNHDSTTSHESSVDTSQTTAAKDEQSPGSSTENPDATQQSEAFKRFDARVEEAVNPSSTDGKDADGDKESPEETSEETEEAGKTDELPAKPEDSASSLAAAKDFEKRPEWKKVVDATRTLPADAAKQVKAVLRDSLLQTDGLKKQIASLTPHAQTVGELRKLTGGTDKGFNQAVDLMRRFSRGDESVIPIFQEMIGLVQKHNGKTLNSEDLVGQAKSIDQQVKDGDLTEDQGKQAKANLLEIEKTRAAAKRANTTVEQTEAEKKQAQFDTLQRENQAAVDGWEATKSKSDADYPKIKRLVESRAFEIGNAKQQKLGRLLNSQELVATCDEALKEIKAEVGEFRPKPKPRQAITDTGSSGQPRPEPKTAFEKFDARVDDATRRRR